MKWFYLLLILVLFACRIGGKSLTLHNKKNTEKKVKKELVISLERTPCYGTCPIYKMGIFSDGSAFYHGERFVKKIGDYEFSVSKETLNYILKKADEIGFFELEDKYTANISDLPTTITIIKTGKQEKKIIDYYGAPKVLKEFESLIDGCIDYRRMKKLKD